MRIPYFRNLPIRRKLTLLLLTPCMVVLLLAGAALVAFQIRMFRSDFARDVIAVADIAGANCTAAVAFNDARAATETLTSLRAKHHIVSAILILPDRSVFAQYGHHSGEPVIAAESHFSFRDKDALMVTPVVLEGKQIATLNVVADYRTVYASLMELVGWMSLLVVVVGAGVATLLSHWLQRLMSDPVLRLARTAQRVADDKNYSVRAREESGAELGILTRAFNQMLTRIQEQDEAITFSQRKLEALVNSIESIVWERDPATLRFSFVSTQSHRILGYSPEQWIADPNFWQAHLHPDDASGVLQNYRRRQEAPLASLGKPYTQEYRMMASNGQYLWIRETGSVLVEHGKAIAMRGIFLDITAQKTAADELERLNRRLVETSRMAGMAEVATGVLHNVGNVLNSVSVSATLVGDRLRQSNIPNLRLATNMLREQNGHLTQFLTADPKGKLLPDYLALLGDELVNDQAALLSEIDSVAHHIEHIKQIVAMQQSYAKVSGSYETLPATALVEDALRMNAAAFDRHRIEVVKEFPHDTPPVCVDRHKVLQILINLLRNAKYAMDLHNTPEKRLVIRVACSLNHHVQISVSDNGVGISAENLINIFNHGFTTKTDGHGFGLHSGANAAKEMGGSLTGRSNGLGLGATFTLELPIGSNSSKKSLFPEEATL